MSTTLPFILHILVADGDPDGLRVVERSNWNGTALTLGSPRPSVAHYHQAGTHLTHHAPAWPVPTTKPHPPMNHHHSAVTRSRKSDVG